MFDNIFSKILPEVNSLVGHLKTLFPIVSVAALVYAKSIAQAETDENEAKRKNKRAKEIVIAVGIGALGILMIPLIWSTFGG